MVDVTDDGGGGVCEECELTATIYLVSIDGVQTMALFIFVYKICMTQ